MKTTKMPKMTKMTVLHFWEDPATHWQSCALGDVCRSCKMKVEWNERTVRSALGVIPRNFTESSRYGSDEIAVWSRDCSSFCVCRIGLEVVIGLGTGNDLGQFALGSVFLSILVPRLVCPFLTHLLLGPTWSYFAQSLQIFLIVFWVISSCRVM